MWLRFRTGAVEVGANRFAKARRGAVGSGLARRGYYFAVQGWARQDKQSRGNARQGLVRRGKVSRGAERHKFMDVERKGSFRRDKARSAVAWSGSVRKGEAWLLLS